MLHAGADVRKIGSGNVVATNVWHALGFKLGFAVAFLDFAKGVAAALLARTVEGDVTALLAGAAAIAGHWRPLFLGFGRGGKVVATSGGVALAVAPLATLAAAAVWIAVFLVTRYASVASMAAAASLPPFALLAGASRPVLGFAVGVAVVIVFLHRANVVRLLRGTETRFELRRGAATRGREASL